MFKVAEACAGGLEERDFKMISRSIFSALGLFTLCVLASPLAYAGDDWQTAMMDQINAQNDQWVQAEAAAAVEQAKLSGVKDSLALGKVYDDAVTKAQDSIAAQMEIQASQNVSWAPSVTPVTNVNAPSQLNAVANNVQNLPTNLTNQAQQQVQKAVVSNVNNLLSQSGLGGLTIPKISAAQLFASCGSKYVNETGYSACGQVDLGDLSGQLSKISQQTAQLSLANIQKTATSYLTQQTTSYVNTTTKSYLLGY